MVRKRKCKNCNTQQLNIYPNKLCQNCLSFNFENKIREKGKEILIDSKALIEQYLICKKSIRQIGRDYEIKPFKVRYYLNEYRIPIRSLKESNSKYIDSKIFEELNPSSTFLLGYIFTDGDLLLNLKTKKYFLRIYSKHKYLIENVKFILKAEAKIQHRGIQKHKDINQSEMFFIHIGNQKVINDLINWGMKLDKSDLLLPKVPDNLLHHFIRGAWTGSGCVSLNKNSVMSSIQLSSQNFIIDLEKELNKIGLKKRVIYKNTSSKKSSYLIKYASMESEKLYKYLYNGDTKRTTCIRQEKLYKEYF
jgi:hypothetical protein